MEERREYTAKDIEVLEGLEPVRLRPGMYIGGTGSRGLHHILWEIIDNSIDEIANGFGGNVEVIVYEDGSVSVEDDGRGIPVDVVESLGITGVEAVFTKLHAGGKFNANNYTFSGGLHGVGSAVTNALSEWLEVVIYKNGQVYRQQFHSIEVDGKIKSGIPKTPLICTGEKTTKHGSFVRFLPDKRVFGDEVLHLPTICKRIQNLAFLNRGVTLSIEDKREVDDSLNPFKEVYHYDGGISDLVAYINADKSKLHDEVVDISDTQPTFKLELALQGTSDFSETISSYVNNISTSDGGTHETGFKSAYTRVMNEYARSRGFLKDKDANLLGEDFREGLTVVLAIKMQNVQFEGQTKGKLGNPEAKNLVENAVYSKLTTYFAEKKHFVIGDALIEKALGAAKAREASKKAKDLARQKNSVNSNSLVGKMAPCTSRKPEVCELFIVEGDSAGGSARQGRDRTTQAILPLRGKPLNAEKTRIERLLANEEICTIIGALGTGIAEDFDISSLRYHKIIILADADQDGGHIRSILLTFFYRYMKQLISEGHVYIGMPPLYKIEKKGNIVYAYDDKEMEQICAEMGKGYKIQRYKGLGEMNADQLWETALNPKTRSLCRVTLENGASNAERMITTWMGDNIEARRQYIFKNAKLDKEDNFAKKINVKKPNLGSNDDN